MKYYIVKANFYDEIKKVTVERWSTEEKKRNSSGRNMLGIMHITKVFTNKEEADEYEAYARKFYQQ